MWIFFNCVALFATIDWSFVGIWARLSHNTNTNTHRNTFPNANILTRIQCGHLAFWFLGVLSTFRVLELNASLYDALIWASGWVVVKLLCCHFLNFTINYGNHTLELWMIRRRMHLAIVFQFNNLIRFHCLSFSMARHKETNTIHGILFQIQMVSICFFLFTLAHEMINLTC